MEKQNNKNDKTQKDVLCLSGSTIRVPLISFLSEQVQLVFLFLFFCCLFVCFKALQ